MNLDLPSMVGYGFNQRMPNAPQVSPPQFLQVKAACKRSQDLSLRNTLSSMCIDLHVNSASVSTAAFLHGVSPMYTVMLFMYSSIDASEVALTVSS